MLDVVRATVPARQDHTLTVLTEPQLQVLQKVVRAIPVNVVNRLPPLKRSPEGTHHHETMLIHLAIRVSVNPERIIW